VETTRRPYSIVNLFTAAVSSGESVEEKEVDNATEILINVDRLTVTREKPLQDSLPIRRLEDAKPVENDLG
jgi:hypothetical protein